MILYAVFLPTGWFPDGKNARLFEDLKEAQKCSELTGGKVFTFKATQTQTYWTKTKV